MQLDTTSGLAAPTQLPANPDATSSTIIAAQHVSLVLGSTRIVNNVSFTISAGTAVALMGANGSGKSTLVRTLLGIHRPTEGTVRLFGNEGTKIPFDRIGYVPQKTVPQAGVPATALEVVRSGLLSRGKLFADRGSQAKIRALEALKLVELEARAHHHVHIFSGGQMQRLAIARALVRRPSLLILDEPLAGVDAQSRHHLAEILCKLKNTGVTMLIVLHETEELTGLLDRAIYMNAGEIDYDGNLTDLPEILRHAREGHTAGRTARHHAPQLTAR